MATDTHTPGPWTFKLDTQPAAHTDPVIWLNVPPQDPRRDRVILAADGLPVALVPWDGHAGIADADARLIAAAPELLDAARGALVLSSEGYGQKTCERLGGEWWDAYIRGGTPAVARLRDERLASAIAKAEGSAR